MFERPAGPKLFTPLYDVGLETLRLGKVVQDHSPAPHFMCVTEFC